MSNFLGFIKEDIEEMTDQEFRIITMQIDRYIPSGSAMPYQTMDVALNIGNVRKNCAARVKITIKPRKEVLKHL